jgi:hypothetical protein
LPTPFLEALEGNFEVGAHPGELLQRDLVLEAGVRHGWLVAQ